MSVKPTRSNPGRVWPVLVAGLSGLGALHAGCVAEMTLPGVDPAAPTAPTQPGAPRVEGVDPAACDPGSKTLHRLNRSEYDRTVKDLLGVTSTPAPTTFPADDTARGFDNNADVLSMSPLLTEKLADAAFEIARSLVMGGAPSATPATATTTTIEAEGLEGAVGGASGGHWNLWSTGELTASFAVETSGRHRVVVQAEQQAAGGDNALMRVSVDGAVLGTVEVEARADHAFELQLAAGTHSVTAAFENDFYDPDLDADRNLLIDAFVVTGPLDAPGPESPDTGAVGVGVVVPCASADAGCADATLRPLLRRAFRRPVTDEEVAGYTALVDGVVTDGDTFEDGLALAIEAMLLSPNFLFRVELDGVSGIHRVADHELASRLSYFIQGTMPDDALLAAADDGSLGRRDVLASEVARLLASPKAKTGAADVLASQWLDSRGLDHAAPDATLYPLSDELRVAMKRETHLVVQALLASDRPAKDILDVDFTFVNAPLAAHYGLPFPTGAALVDADSAAAGDTEPGDGFVRVSLAGTNRTGVLTHGALLAGHSYPFRTSPVKRGRFIIDSLLCIPPGDIPADVPPLSEEATGSVRERMEQHRADPSCAACHAMMDPIGFGLETFDPAGKSRTHDADGFVIDDDDVFFDVAFTGPAGLAAALKQQETLDDCMTERLGSWGLGRGLSYDAEGDVCTIQDVMARSANKGGSFADLLLTIVESDAFQMRRASTTDSTDTAGAP